MGTVNDTRDQSRKLRYLAIGAIVFVVFMSLPVFCNGHAGHDHSHDGGNPSFKYSKEANMKHEEDPHHHHHHHHGNDHGGHLHGDEHHHHHHHEHDDDHHHHHDHQESTKHVRTDDGNYLFLFV